MKPQSAILEPVPAHARNLFFDLGPANDPRAALQALAAACDGRTAGRPPAGNAVDLSALG